MMEIQIKRYDPAAESIVASCALDAFVVERNSHPPICIIMSPYRTLLTEVRAKTPNALWAMSTDGRPFQPNQIADTVRRRLEDHSPNELVRADVLVGYPHDYLFALAVDSGLLRETLKWAEQRNGATVGWYYLFDESIGTDKTRDRYRKWQDNPDTGRIRLSASSRRFFFSLPDRTGGEATALQGRRGELLNRLGTVRERAATAVLAVTNEALTHLSRSDSDACLFLLLCLSGDFRHEGSLGDLLLQLGPGTTWTEAEFSSHETTYQWNRMDWSAAALGILTAGEALGPTSMKRLRSLLSPDSAFGMFLTRPFDPKQLMPSNQGFPRQSYDALTSIEWLLRAARNRIAHPEKAEALWEASIDSILCAAEAWVDTVDVPEKIAAAEVSEDLRRIVIADLIREAKKHSPPAFENHLRDGIDGRKRLVAATGENWMRWVLRMTVHVPGQLTALASRIEALKPALPSVIKNYRASGIARYSRRS